MPEWIPTGQWRTIAAAIAFFVALFAFRLVLKIALSKLARRAEKSTGRLDDELLARVRGPLQALAVVLSASFALQWLDVRLRSHPVAVFGTKLLLILISAWTLDRFVSLALEHDLYPRLPQAAGGKATPKRMSASTRTLAMTALRVLLFSLAFLIVLDTMGISITPVLASLGVGSLAVALALQDTLSNFFSRIYILVDQPIRIGDFIRLEGGTEGYVDDIGWRSTRIRLLNNNLVVIPNSKVSGAMVTNFELPDPSGWVAVPLSVPAERVRSLDELEALAKKAAAEKAREVVVRFNSLTPTVIELTVSLRCAHYADSFELRHEFLKNFHRESGWGTR